MGIGSRQNGPTSSSFPSLPSSPVGSTSAKGGLKVGDILVEPFKHLQVPKLLPGLRIVGQQRKHDNRNAQGERGERR